MLISRHVKNTLTIVLYLMAWWLCAPGIIAQPSVYSGAFVFNEGWLDTAAKQQTITNFAVSAQKDVSIINAFFSWSTSGVTPNVAFPTTTVNYIRGHGSIPLVTWEPWNSSLGVNQSFTLSNIITGFYDLYITDWATSAKNWGHPFFLRFAHEMNGNWYPWCANTNGNTADQYVQAWRHVHDLFLSVGATNVTWVWCVNFVSGMPTPINQLYPGDNYVDWISLDGYNRLANPWQDFSVLAASTMTQLTNIAPGKPIMVAETGCNQTNHPTETKSQWFLDVLTNYLPTHPRIKAWVYFNSTNTSDHNEWRITVPADAVIGYQQGIALSYYDANQYGSISSAPIQPLLNDATTIDTMPPFVSIVNPAMNQVTNGALVKFLALASDKSGVSNVVFSLNGAPQQTNSSPPYQFFWTPAANGTTYTIAATAYDNAGNSAASTVQVISQGVAVTNILQTVSQSSSGDWTQPIWGSPASAAAAGNSYETPTAFFIRTPNSISPAAFAGDSLQIDAGSAFFLKNGGGTSGNAAVVNLVLNGGTINFHGGFAPNGPAMAGTLQVLADSIVTTDQTGINAADIWLQSLISGAGDLTVNMNSTTNSLILSGDNSAYTGNWTNASVFGGIKIESGTTNALGSGSIALVHSGASLIINSTNDMVINNWIGGQGSVLKLNTNTVTLNGGNTFTGTFQITNGTLRLGASASISGATTIRLSNGALLDVAAVSDGFALGVSQTLVGTGNVSGNVAANGTVRPGILNFSNSLSLSGTTIMEINRTNVQNANLISAATLKFGGTLTVTNVGGALQAGDSFQLFSGAITGAFAVTNLPALPSNLFWNVSELHHGTLTVSLKTAIAPAILPLSWNGTSLALRIDSQSGFDYVLQSTTQLTPPNWMPVQTNAGGDQITFTISIDASTQRFFRICVQ